MLADVKIISDAVQALQVASQRYEIMFKDGTSIGLHQVWANGAPVLMLRAVRQGSMFVIFDLTKLAPSLGRELPPTPQRDVAGMVFFTLRSRFNTARECIEAINAVHKTIVPESTDVQPTLFEEAA